MKNSKILLIGGAGFIGNHLVAADLKWQVSEVSIKQLLKGQTK